MHAFAYILDTVSVMAYFIVPIVLVWFLRRFQTILLGNLRTEIKWFALLTASGGVDHLLTALGILPGNVPIQGMSAAPGVFCPSNHLLIRASTALASVLAVAASQMVCAKLRMARAFERCERLLEESRIATMTAELERN